MEFLIADKLFISAGTAWRMAEIIKAGCEYSTYVAVLSLLTGACLGGFIVRVVFLYVKKWATKWTTKQLAFF